MSNVGRKPLQAGWRLTIYRHHFIGIEETHHLSKKATEGQKATK